MTLDFPRPDCAICNKPVDEIHRWVDVCTEQQFILVRCHGAEERVAIEEKLLRGYDRISFGKAFATKSLGPAATWSDEEDAAALLDAAHEASR